MSIDINSAGASKSDIVALQAQILQQTQALDPSFTSYPGSLQDNLTGAGAIIVAQIEDAVAFNINAISPSMVIAPSYLRAYGAGVNLPQKAAIPQTVNVLVTGTPGTIIPIGFTVSGSGGVGATLPIQSIIQSGGTTTVNMIAGSATLIPANVLTTISTPVTGITAVNNPTAGQAGSPAESDLEYFTRLKTAWRAKQQTIPTIIAAVQAVANVIPRTVGVFQNPTSGGIAVVVGGGDTMAVSMAILDNVASPGLLVPNFGGTIPAPPATITTTVSYAGSPGSTYNIVYVPAVPAVTTIDIHLVLSVTIGVDILALRNVMTQAVLAYTNALTVGSSISLTALEDVIITVLKPTISMQYVNILSFTVTGGTVSDEQIIFKPWEYQNLTTADITFS